MFIEYELSDQPVCSIYTKFNLILSAYFDSLQELFKSRYSRNKLTKLFTVNNGFQSKF